MIVRDNTPAGWLVIGLRAGALLSLIVGPVSCFWLGVDGLLIPLAAMLLAQTTSDVDLVRAEDV